MTGKQPVQVMLADDERLIRTALATLLPLDGTIAISGEVSNGRSAVDEFTRRRPDVVILDLDMPGLDGLHAAIQMLQIVPGQAVLLLTRHARPGVLRTALENGIRGFLGKDADPDEITAAVLRLAKGGRVIDPSVAAKAVTDVSPLTEREKDVLRVTGDGYSVRDIAKILHLSPGTVRNYLSFAIQKTGRTTRHDAARHARNNDWL
ncbi:response regulator transcription factor [Corynebacterium glyciniphilum]|uniref:response regulator transcription factor n=1 Tax=Corynebacterium glyciniphilum TaxID=1404244 RepID=UPI003D9FD438